MERQRNMSHMKEQNKAPEKELKERETTNLPDAEFKILVTRMLNKLRERIDELSENFNKNGDRKHEKEPLRNEEYNIRDEYIRGNQQIG